MRPEAPPTSSIRGEPARSIRGNPADLSDVSLPEEAEPYRTEWLHNAVWLYKAAWLHKAEWVIDMINAD